MLQLNKFSTKHDRIEQAFFIVVFVYESSFLEWGASPPNPPGFVALRATTHSARRSLWTQLLCPSRLWGAFALWCGESHQGFEKIITSSRIHGLDPLWLGELWFGWEVKVIKGLRKLLHPPELMAWIHCGLDSCGLDNWWKSWRVWGNYYILQNSWIGSIVAWIVVAWLRGFCSIVPTIMFRYTCWKEYCWVHHLVNSTLVELYICLNVLCWIVFLFSIIVELWMLDRGSSGDRPPHSLSSWLGAKDRQNTVSAISFLTVHFLLCTSIGQFQKSC